MMDRAVCGAMNGHGWFQHPGVYAVFDGQFGSTGKGLLSAAFGAEYAKEIDVVTTNAGPNSGHTAYIDGKKVVTHQLPIASVAAKFKPLTYLNAGAIIDPQILGSEMEEYDATGVKIHPNAALVSLDDKDQNVDISSTGMGTGPSMIRKLSRSDGGTYGYVPHIYGEPHMQGRVILMEVPQGFSLGINQRFYPYCTVRECTPAQGIADLGVSPKQLRKSIAVLRTYPIRTGNLPGSTSGPCYPEQRELSWKDLDLEPEIATTTGRIRRIFSWSWPQFEDMLRATEPDALFLNFMNYLPEWRHYAFPEDVYSAYARVLDRSPDFILTGWGPRAEDIRLWQP